MLFSLLSYFLKLSSFSKLCLKKELPGNYRTNRLFPAAGEKPHSKWQTKFKNNAGTPAAT